MPYTDTNSDYLKKNPTWHAEDSPWKAEQILKMLERNKLAPRTVVEIGCGVGEILVQIQKKLNDTAIQFDGFEIAPDAYQQALTRQNDQLHFHQQNLLETNNFYDLLLMIDVFEHVENYIGFIRESGKKATYKIYHIPLDISIYSILINNFRHARNTVKHIHYFNKETALATLKDSGQEVIDWFYTPGALEVNNKGLSFFGKIINLMRRGLYKINKDKAANTFGGFSLLVLTK